jgi:tetratricopeptide (TPR) repeat protein
VPPRPWYVFTRFVRRNRALSATAAALVASVAAGGVLTTRQARIAERRFEDARQLIHTTIFELQPKLEAIPGTVELRASLIQETSKYLEAVSKDAGDNVPLLKELSSAYLQLARLQGDIGTSSLGRQDLAAGRFEAARTLLERALALEPENPDLLKDASLLYGRLSPFQNARGQSEAAQQSARLAVTYAERHAAARPGVFDAREILAVATFSEAANTPAEQWDLRRTRMERALDLYRGLVRDDPAKESVRRNVGIASRYLASMHTDVSRGAEAARYAREAVEVSAQVLSARPNDTAIVLDVATDQMVLGIAEWQAGRFADAWQALDRAVTLLTGVAAKDAANARATLLTGEVRRYQARVRLAEGRIDEAVSLADQAVARFVTLAAAGPMLPIMQWRHAEALFARADAVDAAGRRADACSTYRRAHDLFVEVDQQAPLTFLVKEDFNTVKARLSACEVR